MHFINQTNYRTQMFSLNLDLLGVDYCFLENIRTAGVRCSTEKYQKVRCIRSIYKKTNILKSPGQRYQFSVSTFCFLIL